MAIVAIFIGLVFVYSLVSDWVERTILTAPIVFTSAGACVLYLHPGLRTQKVSLEVSLWVAELGLVMLLFTDASRTDLQVLKSIKNLPTRLLSTGMLLTILLGALGAMILFRQLSFWEAGIVAAILAPTDAGLGQVIVSSLRVPIRIRQALNVEAGLNDGLSVPFMLFFIALAAASGKSHNTYLAHFILQQLGFGVAIGLGIGLLGGWLLGLAARKKAMSVSFTQIGVVALPLLCTVASEAFGASMFIAAFVAGLALQVGFKEAGRHSVEFAEEWGQLINLFVFFLFGVLAARSIQEFTVPMIVYAVLSLTVVRMLPVKIALIGTGLSKASVIFMGWFGPRGLASIVLGLVYMGHEAHLPAETTIRLIITITVLFSIYAHGLSASPGIDLYAKKLALLELTAPENTPLKSRLVQGGTTLL